jgi:hypothetical protein
MSATLKDRAADPEPDRLVIPEISPVGDTLQYCVFKGDSFCQI